MKKAVKLFALMLVMLSANHADAQWDGSTPPVNTHTTTSNVGIGLGPVFDARLRLLTNSDPSTLLLGSSSLDIIPGFVIQRDFYTNGMTLNGPPQNIMEVWHQQYTGPGGMTAFTPGPNHLKFVIDPYGNIGVGKMPTKQLDVETDANVDGILDVGNIAGSSSAIDALVVHGNVTFTRPLDTHYRNIRARTSGGALVFYANTGGEDGPTMTLNGVTNTTSGSPGGIAFSSIGTGNAPAYDFNNYDPSATPGWNTRMRITANGKVAIGPTTMPIPDGYKLFVKEGILTEKVKVALTSDPSNWADFVFDESYELLSLKEVESYIAKNKHLPDIPSTSDVHKEGLDLAQMDAKLLQKIEELTLYVIQQQKEIEALRQRIK